MSFISGFLKTAEKADKKKRGHGAEAAIGVVAGSAASSIPGGAVGMAGILSGKAATPEERRALLDYFKKHHGVEVGVQSAPTRLNAAFTQKRILAQQRHTLERRARGKMLAGWMVRSGTRENARGVGKHGLVYLHDKSSPGVIAHELGHAVDFKPHRRSLAYVKSRKIGPLLGFGGAVALGNSKDPKKRKWAPAAAAAGFIPMLLQEGKATAHGTQAIAKALGKKKALKSLLTTVPAFASYASPAIGAYYGTKYMLKGTDKK